jgi:hypothetical protein
LIVFFPPCCFEPAILEEGVGDHRQERMTMQALPGSALEMIETEFFFELLVSLLVDRKAYDPNEPLWQQNIEFIKVRQGDLAMQSGTSGAS